MAAATVCGMMIQVFLLLLHLGTILSSSSTIHHHMSSDDLRTVFQVASHDEVPDYEVVHVHSLSKRSVQTDDDGDGGSPETEEVHRLKLTAFGRDVHLTLQRAEGLFKGGTLKMWTAEPNSTQPQEVEYRELPQGEDIGDVYQDEENMAALLVHRDKKNGGLLVEGTIGHDLVVKPVPASVRQHLDQPRDSKRGDDDEMFLDENGEDIQEDVAIETGFPLRRIQSTSNSEPKPQQHIIYRRSSSQFEEPEFSDYAFMEPDHLAKKFRSKRSISKREAPYVIYPEILVIVDYDGYRLHGGDNVQIKRYFVSFWNGVDLRYKLLKGPKIRISIAGIIISRGRDATPYLERNRVGRDAIDSAAALTDMGKYLFRERRLPVYDIAVAVTKYDMCRRRKGGRCTKGTAGFAYVGGACVVNKRLEKVNSVAIIEDTGGFSGIIVGAHEVGHLLGAVHDGSPPPSYLGGPGAEKCRWEDGYIMSDLRHTEKGFRWSSCSISSFHHFLNGDTATCLYNSPHEDESLPRVLPGKLLTLDAQCRKDRGTSACFKDDRVCAQLFCFDAGSGYCVAYRPAAEGSPCGDGQYCLNGRCVAEHENIIPDYSQNTPSYLRRNDADSAATQTRPIYTHPPNGTSQRSPLDEYWSKGSTTTPTPSPNPNKYINNYYNKDNSYFDSTYNTTKNPHTFNQHYTQSTSYFYSSTTKNPYSFNNNQYSTTKNPLSFNIFASYSTTRNLYDFSNNKYTTTKNPYDFGNLNHYTTKSNANSQTPEPVKIFHNYNQYYSSSTTKNPFVGFNYYSTTAKPEHTSNSVYKLLNNNYNAFTTPSTTTTNKILPNYISSASQNSPSIINMNIEASVSNVGDIDGCIDRIANIRGSMTCREFLTHYGFQYCSYKYMQRNCCASQRAVCASAATHQQD
ncbi:A disintegrin and metalloproteinase with thrombospondin motifs 16 isoform X2 [Zootermopsis nevadensis]|uniref:A disintegrin and metalloproteinase with thrombospondin motifs 16 isoform X2 n=1 Tax=Zootermopsis nevadensis TaxID=136037 RepID=UPI000B8EA70D|nr:A disintegrin and metalloproteinase with thrombospondin motifs 16 isoform X2 [Zootermopsis nevadensis]